MKRLILSAPVVLVAMFGVPLAAQTCYLADDRGLTTDQSSVLQRCLDAAIDYSTVSIATIGIQGRMPHVRLDKTIAVNGRFSLAIECPGGHSTGPTGAPGFYWGGIHGGTMVNASGSSGLRLFQHCNFYSALTSNSGSSGGADIIIDIDISKTVGSSVTTTDDTLDDLGLVGSGMSPSFVGIRFSASGDANVEAMRVTNSRIQCSQAADWRGSVGIGIYIAGYTFDALRHRYSDNKVSFCSEGIRALYGIPEIGPANAFQSNGVCITALASPLRIHDNDAENCGQFFVGSTGDAAGIIESNRIAACHPREGESCINVHGSLISRGNTFDSLQGIPITATGGTYLLSEGDAIPDITLFLKGAGTFYVWEVKLHGFGAIYGNLIGGSTIVFQCDHGTSPWRTASVNIFCSDAYTNKFRVSENGGNFKNVVP